MSSQFKQFLELQKDSRTRAIETRIVALTSFFLGYIFFFRLGRTNKAAAWAVTGYLVLSIITLIFSSWLDYFPMKLKEMRVRIAKCSGLALGCLLAPMAVTATLVCSSFREPRQEALLAFYVILSCSMALASILATFFQAFPSPTNISMYFFTVFGMAYGISAFWDYTLPGVKPPAPLFLNISLACVLYAAIVGWLLSMFEGSFSLCEACTIGQGLALTIFDILMCLLNHVGAIRIPASFNVPRTELLLVFEIVVLAFLLSILVLSPLFYKLEQSRSDQASWRFWCASILLGIGLLSAAVYRPCLQALMGGKSPVFWAFSFTLQSRRVPLLLYWALISSCAILVVIAQSSSSSWLAVLKAKDPTSSWFRKWFHLFAMLIYVPGIAVDSDLTTLASTAALVVFLLAEFIRYMKLWPLGDTLHTYLSRFADSKDGGPLILTHIYLLIGFALPLWLFPLKSDRSALPKISLYAGVLALGIGDSLASIAGKSLGKWKITGTNKTVEGACASIVGQAITVTLLPLIDPQVSLYLYSPYDYLCLAAAIIIPAFFEAFTLQIDNLILSPLQFSLLLVSYT